MISDIIEFLTNQKFVKFFQFFDNLSATERNFYTFYTHCIQKNFPNFYKSFEQLDF